MWAFAKRQSARRGQSGDTMSDHSRARRAVVGTLYRSAWALATAEEGASTKVSPNRLIRPYVLVETRAAALSEMVPAAPANPGDTAFAA
jgi:hypothetical protein